MKKYFGRENKARIVPKCQECNLDNAVALVTYKNGEKYWECNSCCCVIKKAKILKT